MSDLKSKVHTAGVIAVLISLAGLASEPQFTGLLPEKWAHLVTATGIVLQAITRGVQQGGVELVPKDTTKGLP